MTGAAEERRCEPKTQTAEPEELPIRAGESLRVGHADVSQQRVRSGGGIAGPEEHERKT